MYVYMHIHYIISDTFQISVHILITSEVQYQHLFRMHSAVPHNFEHKVEFINMLLMKLIVGALMWKQISYYHSPF